VTTMIYSRFVWEAIKSHGRVKQICLHQKNSTR
jgi:hypothetical protein